LPRRQASFDLSFETICVPIDIFNHFTPQKVYETFRTLAPDNPGLQAFAALPALWRLDARLRLMEQFPDHQHVLSLANPPLEMLAGADKSPDLARLANDELAAICTKHPDLFPTFTASMPANNPDAVIREAERAIGTLGARGIQLFTNVNGKPLSAPEFFPIFEYMAQQDLPIWVHPMRGPHFPDYASEDHSENEIWFTFGWPYETSACMTRLIFAGLFDKLPTLKIISHHYGGMIPFFAEKIALGFQQIFFGAPDRNPIVERAGLKKPLLDYFKMLYADTAVNGSAASATCGHAFFGTERSLFATDAPFDSLGGKQLMQGTVDAVNALPISEADKAHIFDGNALTLLKLK
jgi:predicted TIM-barrel fold metal-dependent hydrolase